MSAICSSRHQLRSRENFKPPVHDNFHKRAEKRGGLWHGNCIRSNPSHKVIYEIVPMPRLESATKNKSRAKPSHKNSRRGAVSPVATGPQEFAVSHAMLLTMF